MANEELPKDYSSVYCEDIMRPPIPPMRRVTNTTATNTMLMNHNSNNNINRHHNHNNQSHQTQAKWSDGANANKRQCESTVDLRAVVAKLQNLPQENHRAYAMDTLNKHYSSVFTNRRRSDKVEKAGFKAYIQYFDEKDTYVVRVERNTLKAVRDKLPKRGDYRYFFKQLDNTCEEVESDGSFVPFHEKDGSRQIYCQVFSY